MSVLILLIAAGGTVASGFLAAFVWAVRSGQFDDTWTPAVRVLLDARTAGTGERDALPTADNTGVTGTGVHPRYRASSRLFTNNQDTR
jgi:cbb3-type cytochrome oxidase maturation protein